MKKYYLIYPLFILFVGAVFLGIQFWELNSMLEKRAQLYLEIENTTQHILLFKYEADEKYKDTVWEPDLNNPYYELPI